MPKKKDKPEKPPRRRNTDWFCNRCRRPLENDGRDTLDTVTGKEGPGGVLFRHDQCGGSVMGER